MANGTTAGRWFRRVVWVGIVANILIALPLLAAPSQMMALAGLPTATPELWPRFAAVQMILLSVFYIPAAQDIDRHRITAWFTVVSRLAGVVFFLFEPGYRMAMSYELAFLVPEGILLTLAVRSERAPGRAEARAV